MKHTYTVTGMTCGNCKASVEKHLQSVEGVSEVEVDLDASEASVTMEKHIATETFQEVLPKKYSLSEKKETNIFTERTSEAPKEQSKLQQLKALLLIFLYISATAVLLNYNNWNASEAMLDFMGLFFIVFSFFKMLDLKGFPESFRMYDPLAKVIPAYGWIYPFIETALGLMFLTRFEVTIAIWITIVVLGITTIGVTKTLLDKKSIQCACLGTALKLPMTEATFIENTIMLLMSALLLVKIYAS